MSIALIEPFSGAPAGTYSSFANDDRCYEVHYIAADSNRDVREAIADLMDADPTLIDYDIHHDDTIDRWVGITCRDYKETDES